MIRFDLNHRENRKHVSIFETYGLLDFSSDNIVNLQTEKQVILRTSYSQLTSNEVKFVFTAVASLTTFCPALLI